MSTTIFEHDFTQLRAIAEHKGLIWPMGTGKREGSMNSAATIHFLIQDYIGRRP